jgi:hypothetical protein
MPWEIQNRKWAALPNIKQNTSRREKRTGAALDRYSNTFHPDLTGKGTGKKSWSPSLLRSNLDDWLGDFIITSQLCSYNVRQPSSCSCRLAKPTQFHCSIQPLRNRNTYMSTLSASKPPLWRLLSLTNRLFKSPSVSRVSFGIMVDLQQDFIPSNRTSEPTYPWRRPCKP